MSKAETIVHVAKQLPGYYGYLPVWSQDELEIEEVWFQLYEDDLDVHYHVTLFFQQEQVADAMIAGRYSDSSILYVREDNEEHHDIWSHVQKIIALFNKTAQK